MSEAEDRHFERVARNRVRDLFIGGAAIVTVAGGLAAHQIITEHKDKQPAEADPLYRDLEAAAQLFENKRLKPPFRHQLRALAANLAVQGCITKGQLLEFTGINDTQFSRAMGFLTKREVTLSRAVAPQAACQSTTPLSAFHYEPTELLTQLTDQGLGGEDYQELVTVVRLLVSSS